MIYGLRQISLGLSVALAGSIAQGQTPANSSAPSQRGPAGASLGRILAVESVAVRAQAPADPAATIVPVRGVSPQPTILAPAPVGGHGMHPGANSGGPLPPGAFVSGPLTKVHAATNPIFAYQSPTPGTPGSTPPPAANGTTGVPMTNGMTTSPPMPGTLPPGTPGVLEQRNSVPGASTAPASPLLGGGIPFDGGCSPTPIVGAPVEGTFDQPVLSDPFLGVGSPVFPRLRNALGRVVGGPLGGRLTLEADYLLWFIRAEGSPVLVTTSSPANNGILGQGDTRTLYGNQTLGDTLHSGGRFAATYWLPNSRLGVDASIFFLGRNISTFRADSSTDPVLARPFIRADTGAQFSELVASPGLATGSVTLRSETSMYGAEVSVRRPLFCGCNSRLDGLLGFRNVNLEESLTITESFVRAPGSTSNFASGVVEDRFRTENHFYGVNLGLTGELRRGRFFTSYRAAVGLGSVYQELQVAGSQNLVTTAGLPAFADGGLLALPSNNGSYNQRKFGVVPEANLTFGLYLTQHLRFGVGYNFLYMNSVLRPANQIDTVVDVTRIPNFPVPGATSVNPARPRALPLRTTDVFAQGVTFSLQYTW